MTEGSTDGNEHYRRVVGALGGRVNEDEEMVEMVELQARTIKAQTETIKALQKHIALLSGE